MAVFEDLKMQYKMGGFEQKIIYWNVAAFLISIAFFYEFKLGFFDFPKWISLSSNGNELLWKPWTLLTYSFFTPVFTLIVQYACAKLFWSTVSYFFTQKQFLGLYLLSGIFAGLVFIASYFVLGRDSSIVGASGAIMAILVAAATYSPLMNLRMLLIGNVKLWQVAAVVVIIDLLQMFVENTGGHIAHLAGAFFGFSYIKLLQNGTDLSKGVSYIFDTFANLFSRNKKSPLKTVHRNYERKPENKVSKIVTKDKTQQQIDEILDKISQSGYDSLTKEEKEFLFKAGK